MKFRCDQCNAQYMISDEKIGKKGIRVRCKKCSTIITVRLPSGEDAVKTATLDGPQAGSRDREETVVDRALGDGPPGEESDQAPVDNQLEGDDREVASGESEDEFGSALDNVFGDDIAGEEGSEGGDSSDLDHQATRVFSAEDIERVEAEKAQASRLAEERKQISDIYHKALASDDEEAVVAGPARAQYRDEESERVEWYAAVDERQVGPISLTEISQRWRQGEFDTETLVWKSSFEDWIPIFEVEELRFLLVGSEEETAAKETGWREEAGELEVDRYGKDVGAEEEAGEEAEEEMGGLYDDEEGVAADEGEGFAGGDVEWKPSAISELNSLAKEELATLKPPPDSEQAGKGQSPRGQGRYTEGDALGEASEMDDGDSSIVAQIAAEEEKAARLTEQEKLERERRTEEARKKKAEEALAAQGEARREREREQRERAAPPPEQMIPSRSTFPKWAIALISGGSAVVILLLGFIAYKMMAGSTEGVARVQPVPYPITPTGVPAKVQTAAPIPQPAAVTSQPAAMAPQPGAPIPVSPPVASEPSPEEKETAAEKATMSTKARATSLKKKPIRKTTQVASVMKESPPPPPPPVESEKKPPRKKEKGDILDFEEDEAAFAKETGDQPQPQPKKVEPKKKELPPLSNADVLSVMRKHLAEFQACSRKQLEHDSSVKGKMVVDFVINPNGRVARVNIATDKFKNTVVADCISRVIKQLSFPEFGGDPKSVPFPFTVK